MGRNEEKKEETIPVLHVGNGMLHIFTYLFILAVMGFELGLILGR